MDLTLDEYREHSGLLMKTFMMQLTSKPASEAGM